MDIGPNIQCIFIRTGIGPIIALIPKQIGDDRISAAILLQSRLSRGPALKIVAEFEHVAKVTVPMSARHKADITARAERCPLLGVKRTWPAGYPMSAFDPKRTSAAASNLPILVDKMPCPEPRGRQ